MKKQRQFLSPKVRFWKYVAIIPFHECWEWIGTKTSGYGYFGTGQRCSKVGLAHRFSYELHYGPFDKSLDVCHKCDNPGCVRPEHLFLGTHQDNMADKIKKGRAIYINGERCHSAKLDEKKVFDIRDLRKNGMLVKDIAKRFNVTSSAICSVVKRKTWKHI